MRLPAPGRGTLAVVAALTVAGGALRALTVGAQSLWFDELVTASLLRGGFGAMLDAIPTSERTPYLYYVLAWPVVHLLGDGEVGVRALSVVVGTATIPVAYLAGRELASRRVGLVAAGLVAVNPMLVWYAQEARSYALLAFLATTGLWLFARARGHGGHGALAAWAVVSSLALATHYFAALAVLPQAALLVARPASGRRARAAAWTALPLLVLLAHLPLLREQSGAPGGPIAGVGLASRLAGVLKAAVVGFGAPAEILVALAGAALATFAVVLALTRAPARERRGAILCGALALVAVLGALVLVPLGRDYVLARNLIVTVPCVLIALAVGFAATRAGRVAAVALGALSLVVALAPAVEPVHGRTDWRGAAEALAPGDAARAIVVTPPIAAGYWAPYLPGLTEIEGEATVEEIVSMGLATQGGFGTGELRPPSAASPPPAPPGFEVADVHEGQTFTTVRYRAPAPTPVTVEQLRALRLGDTGEGGRELLQQPAG